MSLKDVLAAEAEQSAYVSAVSQRIGELVADKINADGFLNASDDDLRNMAMTVLLLVMNELGDEALASAVDTAQALGFEKPTTDTLDSARQAALEGNANRLYTALEEQRAKAQKAAKRNDGVVSDSLATGITAALAIAFADAAQGLATDLPVELNGAMAEDVSGQTDATDAADTTDTTTGDAAVTAAAADVADTAAEEDTGILAGLVGLGGLLTGGGVGMLTWITRYDDSVCQEDGPSVLTPSGNFIPAGGGTSCEARHGITLPADDWISEGFPRDARLLCSRFGRPRCRCLLSVTSDVPEKAVNMAPDIAKGKARGAAEQLDLTDAHLNGLSVSATGQQADPNLWNISIRVSKRPVLVPA